MLADETGTCLSTDATHIISKITIAHTRGDPNWDADIAMVGLATLRAFTASIQKLQKLYDYEGVSRRSPQLVPTQLVQTQPENPKKSVAERFPARRQIAAVAPPRHGRVKIKAGPCVRTASVPPGRVRPARISLLSVHYLEHAAP
jgi:hypothetical protein